MQVSSQYHYAVDIRRKEFSSDGGTHNEQSLNKPLYCKTDEFRSIGDLSTAILDQIEANSARVIKAHRLVDAVLDCGDDARPLLETIHALLSPGIPIPNPYGLMPEARIWSELASEAEREAYALACFERMRPERQADLLRHIGARAAA